MGDVCVTTPASNLIGDTLLVNTAGQVGTYYSISLGGSGSVRLCGGMRMPLGTTLRPLGATVDHRGPWEGH